MSSGTKPTTLERLQAIRPTVSVGVLAADLMHLGSEVAVLEEAGVEVVHVDVMDGCFAPMMTVGPLFVKGLRTRLLKDVHLMVHEPLGKIAGFVEAGADMVTVHVESTIHVHRLLRELARAGEGDASAGGGVVRGIALNPGTPLAFIEPLLDEVEMIVLLAVDPGWGGQAFIPSTFARAAAVRDMVERAGRDILLCIDGGVTRANVAEVAAAGADLVVAGSAVFDGGAVAANARFMLERAREAGRATRSSG